MEKDINTIKKQIRNLQAKKRRTELVDDAIRLTKEINELKRKL